MVFKKLNVVTSGVGDIKEAVDSFLGKHGRINYIKPLYTAFAQRDKETAMATFEKYRSFYHPLVFKYIVLALRALK